MTLVSGVRSAGLRTYALPSAALTAALVLASAAGPAFAEGDPAATDTGDDATPATSEDTRPATTAVGLSAGFARQNDYGTRKRNVFIPELVGFLYQRTGRDRLFVRPGARLGYVGLSPAEMPRALRLRERDFTVAAELGAVYDGPIVPAVSAGAGVRLRQLTLETVDPVRAESARTDWEWLPTAHAQAAAGVPIGTTGLVFEPYARYEVIAGDDRARWRLGVDITFDLFGTL